VDVKLSVFYSLISKNDQKKYFFVEKWKFVFSDHFRLMDKIRKIFTSMLVLHVKLQHQWVKTLEMRTKPFDKKKFLCFMPVFSRPDQTERSFGKAPGYFSWDVIPGACVPYVDTISIPTNTIALC
jgi:hypothetical protein